MPVPDGLSAMCTVCIDEIASSKRGSIVPTWPGLCRWWSTPECAFCEIGEAMHGECLGSCRFCKIRLRDGCPCVDPGLREILDAQGLWWPGSTCNPPPQDWLDSRRRSAVNGRWHEVYGEAIARERKALGQWESNRKHGGECAVCGAPITPGSTYCRDCRPKRRMRR